MAISLALTVVLSAVFDGVIAEARGMEAGGGLYVAGRMWSPGVAALVARLVVRGNLGGPGWRWGKTRYQVLSIAVPFLVVLGT